MKIKKSLSLPQLKTSRTAVLDGRQKSELKKIFEGRGLCGTLGCKRNQKISRHRELHEEKAILLCSRTPHSKECGFNVRDRRTLVMSLGGSVIIPEQKNDNFLLKLRATLKKYYRTHKFVLVCGGGSIARAYITLLEKEHKNHREQSEAGIRATRMNAELYHASIRKRGEFSTPEKHEISQVRAHKNNVVVSGALRYAPHQTSDTTAAKLAAYLKSEFVNLTNVPGLYTSDPRKNKAAKLIPHISWKEFEAKAHAIRFSPGEHFVLDQKASTLIRKHKIKTFIMGKDANNLKKFLNNEKWLGTQIDSQ